MKLLEGALQIQVFSMKNYDLNSKKNEGIFSCRIIFQTTCISCIRKGSIKFPNPLTVQNMIYGRNIGVSGMP